MSEQYWGCLDKMSEVNISPAETLNSVEQDQLAFENPANLNLHSFMALFVNTC